jgi:hypothetical protein
MQKVEDYRKHADECRAMAPRSPEERDMLLNMARTWDDLASHRAAQITRHQRMKDAVSSSESPDAEARARLIRTFSTVVRRLRHLAGRDAGARPYSYTPNSATTVSAILSGSNSPA